MPIYRAELNWLCFIICLASTCIILDFWGPIAGAGLVSLIYAFKESR